MIRCSRSPGFRSYSILYRDVIKDITYPIGCSGVLSIKCCLTLRLSCHADLTCKYYCRIIKINLQENNQHENKDEADALKAIAKNAMVTITGKIAKESGGIELTDCKIPE